MSVNYLSLSISDGIAQIIIDRADKRNAMSLEMWAEMRRLVTAATSDRSALAIVLRGVDVTAFASGADIEEMLSIATTDDAWALMDAVIAMIRGFCIGGGIELALGCDLRFAAKAATFAVPPAKLGLVYSLSSTKRLIELVGLGRARDLLYSARSFDAAEAFRMGLVERVFEDDEIEQKTLEYVELLARRSQYSIRAAKRVSAAAMAGGSDDDEEIRDLRAAAFSGEDLKEGLTAFVSKRVPDFSWR
jgi:enoyl-CoA hydratase/carnithine racemase